MNQLVESLVPLSDSFSAHLNAGQEVDGEFIIIIGKKKKKNSPKNEWRKKQRNEQEMWVRSLVRNDDMMNDKNKLKIPTIFVIEEEPFLVSCICHRHLLTDHLFF